MITSLLEVCCNWSWEGAPRRKRSIFELTRWSSSAKVVIGKVPRSEVGRLFTYNIELGNLSKEGRGFLKSGFVNN